MQELINDLQERLDGYNGIIAQNEARGIENLNLEETEDYGCFKGKAELLEELIPKLEALKS